MAIGRWVRRTAAAASLLALALALLAAFPQPLFSYAFSHANYRVRSDRPIDPMIVGVLDDASRRLRTSDLYDPRVPIRIFICNDSWRLWLYARSGTIGGSTDTLVTRNIYLREADIAANRLVPPSGTLADAEARPLSYFIAHEAAHAIQSRAFGRLMRVRYPNWLVEGHADLIAKGGDFDFEENLQLLQRDDPRLDHGRSGLYRGYHLMVAFLTGRRGWTVRGLFADPPAEEDVLRAMRTARPASAG